MPVFVLWSAPRSRSTAFFRSMLERGDLVALHEPLEGLAYLGPIEVEDRTFVSVASLVAWLLGATQDIDVFLKETVNRRVLDVVLSEHRFLAEVRHAFLIRRPEEIAMSWYALERDMRIEDAGLVLLYELHTAVREAGGHRPVVIDSDDLVARPDATMAAYCAAVGLPFLPDALRWEPGERIEWARTARPRVLLSFEHDDGTDDDTTCRCSRQEFRGDHNVVEGRQNLSSSVPRLRRTDPERVGCGHDKRSGWRFRR